MVGAAGFEPATPCPPDRGPNRAAPRSDRRRTIGAGTDGRNASVRRSNRAGAADARAHAGGDGAAPQRAEQQPEMAPVISVDDRALEYDADEGREDREHDGPPRRVDLDGLEADDKRERDEQEIGDAGNPAAGHEGVEIDVVRGLGEIADELQRPDAERVVAGGRGAGGMAGGGGGG